MNFLAMISAAVFAVLGVLHLVYTIHDFGEKPRYFRPLDRALLAAMRQTHAVIAPIGRRPSMSENVIDFGVLALKHSVQVCSAIDVRFVMQNDIQQ